jgi:hypothetical protein
MLFTEETAINFIKRINRLVFVVETYYIFYCEVELKFRRSQWTPSLRHELSSLARTLGSWVRIPLKAWVSAFIMCLCFCV